MSYYCFYRFGFLFSWFWYSLKKCFSGRTFFLKCWLLLLLKTENTIHGTKIFPIIIHSINIIQSLILCRMVSYTHWRMESSRKTLYFTSRNLTRMTKYLLLILYPFKLARRCWTSCYKSLYFCQSLSCRSICSIIATHMCAHEHTYFISVGHWTLLIGHWKWYLNPFWERK